MTNEEYTQLQELNNQLRNVFVEEDNFKIRKSKSPHLKYWYLVTRKGDQVQDHFVNIPTLAECFPGIIKFAMNKGYSYPRSENGTTYSWRIFKEA